MVAQAVRKESGRYVMNANKVFRETGTKREVLNHRPIITTNEGGVVYLWGRLESMEMKRIASPQHQEIMTL
jgi:hypothetical protein